ncbi:MAG: MATE family efflux transporter [Phycisphaerae bacterium]
MTNVRTERPTLDLLRLAAPMIGLTASRMLMTFVDFLMVSRLGTEAQAAISPATIFVFAIGCLGMGAAQSVQTFVSQCDGRNEPRRAGGYVWQAMYLALFFALATVPVTLAIEFWYSPLMRLVGCAESVIALQVDYIEVGVWSVGPSIACAGLLGFLNGIQRPGLGLIAMVVSILVNIAGNAVLINGLFGFPELGVAGAAYATVFAWIVRGLIMFAAFMHPQFNERYAARHSLRFDVSKFMGIVRVGGPIAVQWLVDISAMWAFLTLIIPTFGAAQMAASNIVLQLMHGAFMPAIGIGIALCTQVGFSIGRGQPEQAYARTRIAMRVAAIYMGMAGLIMFVFRRPLVALLDFENDSDVVQAGSIAMIWAAALQVFDAMAIIYINALRGAGDTRNPAIVNAASTWIVFIGTGALISRLRPEWGLHGPWMMFLLHVTVIGLYLRHRFRVGKWKEIRLLGNDPVPVDSLQESHPAGMKAPSPTEVAP